jgi:small subunit ribosomal protein S4
MARYVAADCKRCRREKMKLFLKGSKCESPKCPFEKRPYPPGQHGRGRTKDSEYLLQLREKQKATRMYGVLEKQFSNYYKEAQRQAGKTGENLLQILESRLDNVVYRAGFAKSRDMARQFVTHGHFLVNGKKVNIPSYRVSPNDIVEVRVGSREMTPFVIAHVEQIGLQQPLNLLGDGRTALAWKQIHLQQGVIEGEAPGSPLTG